VNAASDLQTAQLPIEADVSIIDPIEVMSDEDRFKAFSSHADISRKWVAIMDAKAGFVAALNMGLLAFLWTGAKLSEAKVGPVRWCVIGASLCALSSVLCAIWVAMPRERLTEIFGRKAKGAPGRPAPSYYGYVANTFGHDSFEAMKAQLRAMTFADLADEAIEQQLVISHSVAKKSKFVSWAGRLLLAALSFVGVGLLLKVFM
jgi:hypothetical protein